MVSPIPLHVCTRTPHTLGGFTVLTLAWTWESKRPPTWSMTYCHPERLTKTVIWATEERLKVRPSFPHERMRVYRFFVFVFSNTAMTPSSGTWFFLWKPGGSNRLPDKQHTQKSILLLSCCSQARAPSQSGSLRLPEGQGRPPPDRRGRSPETLEDGQPVAPAVGAPESLDSSPAGFLTPTEDNTLKCGGAGEIDRNRLI